MTTMDHGRSSPTHTTSAPLVFALALVCAMCALSLAFPVSTPVVAGAGCCVSLVVWRRTRSATSLVALVLCATVLALGLVIDFALLSVGEGTPTVRHALPMDAP